MIYSYKTISFYAPDPELIAKTHSYLINALNIYNADLWLTYRNGIFQTQKSVSIKTDIILTITRTYFHGTTLKDETNSKLKIITALFENNIQK